MPGFSSLSRFVKIDNLLFLNRRITQMSHCFIVWRRNLRTNGGIKSYLESRPDRYFARPMNSDYDGKADPIMSVIS